MPHSPPINHKLTPEQLQALIEHAEKYKKASLTEQQLKDFEGLLCVAANGYGRRIQGAKTSTEAALSALEVKERPLLKEHYRGIASALQTVVGHIDQLQTMESFTDALGMESGLPYQLLTTKEWLRGLGNAARNASDSAVSKRGPYSEDFTFTIHNLAEAWVRSTGKKAGTSANSTKGAVIKPGDRHGPFVEFCAMFFEYVAPGREEEKNLGESIVRALRIIKARERKMHN